MSGQNREPDGRRVRAGIACEARGGARFAGDGSGEARPGDLVTGWREPSCPVRAGRPAMRVFPFIARFVRDTRAGATAITAAAVVMMTIAGTALIVDHVWLVNQRDVLKSAADAGSVAATLGLLGLPSSMSDTEAEAALQPVAERYVVLNVWGNLPRRVRDRMMETLEVTLDLNRAAGTVEVVAKADMGGTLLSRWFLDYAGPSDGIVVDAGVGATISATELVLAIDVTGSMRRNLDGDFMWAADSRDPSRRIEIVKRAARDLVDILASREESKVAVGLVPWDYRVRLDESTRREWERRGWAVYPAHRTYPHPARGPGPDLYPPEEQVLPAQGRLPSSCRAWAGCLDMRADRFSLAMPADAPFLMNFFTEQTSNDPPQYASYACQDYTRSEAGAQSWDIPVCYDIDRVPEGQQICASGDIQEGGPRRLDPQDTCIGSVIMPLSRDIQAVGRSIDGLMAWGPATYSSAGLAWAMRLLSPSWRAVWGHAEHPMDADDEVQKVIVLLTDGGDNHYSYSDARRHRQQGCDAAKAQGILIFTIAAMHPREVSEDLAGDLEVCSSQSDYPAGKYAFVNNATPAALTEAFAEIGRQIMSLRRTH